MTGSLFFTCSNSFQNFRSKAIIGWSRTFFLQKNYFSIMAKLEINEIALIDMLDNDSLAEIFSYLSIQERLQMEIVCSRWRKVAKENWHDVKQLSLLRKFNKLTSRKKIIIHYVTRQLMIRCGRFLKHLTISSVFNSKILQVIHDNCRNLISLDLQITKYSKNHLLGTFSNMKKLKSLTMDIYDQNISLFDCLQSVHEDIEHISWGGNYGNDLIIPFENHILAKFSNLRSITINYHIIGNTDIEAITQNRKLIHLNLSGCHCVQYTSLMPLSEIVNLEYLNLSYAFRKVDDNFLFSLIRNSKNLYFLDISGSHLVSERGINELVKLSNLRVLNIGATGINFNADIKLWPFPKLKDINCNGLRVVNDKIVKYVLENNPNIYQLKLCRSAVSIESMKYANEMMKGSNYNRELWFFVDESIQQEFDKLKDKSIYFHVIGY